MLTSNVAVAIGHDEVSRTKGTSFMNFIGKQPTVESARLHEPE